MYVLDEVVVKIDLGSRSGSLRERSALEILAPTALPVPRLIGHGSLSDGRPWLMMSRLPGRVPVDADRLVHDPTPKMARQLGALMAELHLVRPPGFGAWAEESISLIGEDKRRTDILFDMARRDQAVPAREITALADWLEVNRPILETAPAWPVLAHRDVCARNALVDGAGRVVGLLDFELSGGGDAAEDFSRIGLDWYSAGFEGLCYGYAQAGGRLDSDSPARVAHYVGSWVLAIYAYLVKLIPAYLPPARVAVERLLDGERPHLGPAVIDFRVG